MTAVIAMLRAVNLAGLNRIKMEVLREACESAGFKNPRTYVQSGNVVFGCGTRDLPYAAARVKKAIEQRSGFGPEVIVRTRDEMREVVAANPFAGRRDLEPATLLVTFLEKDPGKQARDKALAIKVHPEELHIVGREMYIYYPAGMGRSKLPAAAIGKALRVTGTARNWNTVTKLLEMAEAWERE
jgi:uncharacterized protein (DUF1697 family)